MQAKASFASLKSASGETRYCSSLMMMLAVIMVVMVAVATVSAAFRLKGGPAPLKIRSEATEHILDHMVGPNAKNMVSNFGRQMPISQMPSKAHQADRIFVSDFDDGLRSGLNLQPSSVVQLQAISIGHGNGFWKIKKNIFALIRGQANAAAMARVKVESERCLPLFPSANARRDHAMNVKQLMHHVILST